jgi:hypothetical protein
MATVGQRTADKALNGGIVFGDQDARHGFSVSC